MQPSAKIIADSISPQGVRLTTMQITTHRFVLAEFNTHRVFSRNSASSRAIPFRKQLAKVCDDPALPLVWAGEQRGMQGGAEIEEIEKAEGLWLDAQNEVMKRASDLADLGVHKSLVNRLLEPWMSHTIVCTSTAWDNFFLQRCHEAAQPEIRVAAEMMREAYEHSEPRRLQEGEWHLPYVENEDWEALHKSGLIPLGVSGYPEMAKISAARCARVSYLTQDGKRDISEDLNLYDRLTDRQQDAIHAHSPIHWSPLEHVATPWALNRQSRGVDFMGFDGDWHDVQVEHLPKVGNLLGWRSLRTEEEAKRGEQTYR